jgi:hypothetical protein
MYHCYNFSFIYVVQLSEISYSTNHSVSSHQTVTLLKCSAPFSTNCTAISAATQHNQVYIDCTDGVEAHLPAVVKNT